MSCPNPSSADSGKSCDVVSDKFPVGLRVLVVDDDPTCLRILEAMLKNCLYEVTKCNQAEVALTLLRENKDGFDIVISDVYMPDMDGFTLLEKIGLEMDLPVIMMSADDRHSVVMNGVRHGACDYLIKPVRMEALKNIWQHVFRRKKYESIEKDSDQKSGSVGDGTEDQVPNDSSSGNEEDLRNSRKRRTDEDDEGEENGNMSSTKKPRVVWTVDLHRKFLEAVKELGMHNAVPKKILKKMDEPGLTRENVASHLQKYRLCLRRLIKKQQSECFNNSPMPQPTGQMMPFRTIGTGKHELDQTDVIALEELRSSFSRSEHRFGSNVNMHHTSSSSSQTGPYNTMIGQPQILNRVGPNPVGIPITVFDHYGINNGSSGSLMASFQPGTFAEPSETTHFQDPCGNNNFLPLVSSCGFASNNSNVMMLQEQQRFSNGPNGLFIPNYDDLSLPNFASHHGNGQQLMSSSLVDESKVDTGFENALSADDDLWNGIFAQDAPGLVFGPNGIQLG